MALIERITSWTAPRRRLRSTAGAGPPGGPGASGPGEPGYDGRVTLGDEGAAEPAVTPTVPTDRRNRMAEQPDTSKGWCCDGRTYVEHAGAGGDCCQPEGKHIDDLPDDGQRAARERIGQSGS